MQTAEPGRQKPRRLALVKGKLTHAEESVPFCCVLTAYGSNGAPAPRGAGRGRRHGMTDFTTRLNGKRTAELLCRSCGARNASATASAVEAKMKELSSFFR